MKLVPSATMAEAWEEYGRLKRELRYCEVAFGAEQNDGDAGDAAAGKLDRFVWALFDDARPADSPYVTTRLAEAADRAAKAEARAEKAEAEAQANRNSALLDDIEVAREEVVVLTARAERAEQLLEMEQGSREAWRKEAQEAHACVTAVEDQVAELTRELDKRTEDILVIERERGVVVGRCYVEIERLTAKLDEARGVLRGAEARLQICSSCHADLEMETGHAPGCRLASCLKDGANG